jgi:hypothetical protein
MDARENKIRSDSFFPVPRRQFEYCLIPLWFYGVSTQEEISSTIKIPLTVINEKFDICLSQDLIQLSETNTIKDYNFNYTLSTKGKEIVKKILKLKTDVA